MKTLLTPGNPRTIRIWVIIGICIFAAILVLTAYTLIFQSGSSQSNASFPNSVFLALRIDTLSKYGLIVFSSLALCFLILGYPRSK